jgi:putative holliday junction resolvase
MPRIIAIDYGLKRVGLAVTDPLQIIATPLETVETRHLMDFLKKYTQTEEVETIVVGHPTRLDGQDTHTTQAVLQLVETLKNVFPDQKIDLHDERFTSSMALKALIASGTKKKDRQQKGNIDKVSAAIILQSFMDKKI